MAENALTGTAIASKQALITRLLDLAGTPAGAQVMEIVRDLNSTNSSGWADPTVFLNSKHEFETP